MVQQLHNEPAVVLNNVQFVYPGCGPFLKDVSLELPRGSRTLLIGANGAGPCRQRHRQQLIAYAVAVLTSAWPIICRQDHSAAADCWQVYGWQRLYPSAGRVTLLRNGKKPRQHLPVPV